MNKPRKLKANEIETRVQMINKNGTGCMLLLYKDARADMKILDETFGITGWKRTHQQIGDNLYCTVSIKDKETGEWIEKQDVGVESFSDGEKGQASDSFKRACFNVGIGRELYTAPFIWVGLNQEETYDNKRGGKGLKSKIKFSVSKIAYDDDGNISSLEIVDQDNKTRYTKGKRISKTVEKKVNEVAEKEKQVEVNDKNIQINIMGTLVRDKNFSSGFAPHIKEKYNANNVNDLNEKQRLEVIKFLQDMKNAG